MNNTDNFTTAAPHADKALTDAAEATTLTLTTLANTTIPEVVTTAVPPAGPDSAVIAVVIVLILLTLAALGFLLYRYLCHNKGAYRTTGELAPGEDPDEEYTNQGVSEKKEYFI